MSYSAKYLRETAKIASLINPLLVDKMAEGLAGVRNSSGRLFLLGVGGGAGHASHAVNDFRKICGFEAYTPTDNISELTARINDDGWPSSYAEWLRGSHLRKGDGMLVFSVGGGNKEKKISVNIVHALNLAREANAAIFGIVGRDGGYTALVADICIIIPTLEPESITQHTEAFQSVILHLLVGHPKLKIHEMKWEATQ
jgi:D-sedoheptulose 7-phosphate isomerase